MTFTRQTSGRPLRSLSLSTCIALTTLFCCSSVSAKKSLKIGATITSLMMEKGECGLLMVADKDVTKDCRPYVINNSFSDGRVGFIFGTTSGAVMSFSGTAKQIAPDEDTALQPIDRITFTYSKKTENVNAVGNCRYTNPYKGKATVICQAEAAEGLYKGEFLTDGTAPLDALTK